MSSSQNSKRVVFLDAPMVTGKIYLAKQYIRSLPEDTTVLSITFRQSLAKYLANEFGVDCYLDEQIWNDDNKRMRERLVICLDSLLKLKEDEHYDVVIIDEATFVQDGDPSVSMHFSELSVADQEIYWLDYQADESKFQASMLKKEIEETKWYYSTEVENLQEAMMEKEGLWLLEKRKLLAEIDYWCNTSYFHMGRVNLSPQDALTRDNVQRVLFKQFRKYKTMIISMMEAGKEAHELNDLSRKSANYEVHESMEQLKNVLLFDRDELLCIKYDPNYWLKRRPRRNDN